MKIKVLIVALMISLFGCVLLTYLWIDRSISLSYARQSVDAEVASVRRLERLLGREWDGRSEKSIFEMLREEAARYPSENIVVKKESGVVWFEETRFNFENGKLKSVGGI